MRYYTKIFYNFADIADWLNERKEIQKEVQIVSICNRTSYKLSEFYVLYRV